MTAAAKKRRRRNPIVHLGRTAARDHTRVPNRLIRKLIGEFGGDSDPLVVLLYLMSHGDGWETSANAISEDFHWGQNSNRASRALHRLADADYLVIRAHVRADGGRLNTKSYVLRADGSRLTTEEREKWSDPLMVKTVARESQ